MSPPAATAPPAEIERLPSRPLFGQVQAQRRLLVAALYLVALAIGAQLVWSSVVKLHGTKGTDFLVIHEAARAVVRGERLYDTQRIARDLFGANYHLPPFAAVVAVPFALLGADEALTAWRLLALAAHFGALGLVLRTLGVPWSAPLAPVALAVWAFAWPARATFIFGQWDGFFLLALSVAWWAERTAWAAGGAGDGWRAALAGGVVALAGSVKPYPLLALGYFATRRRWGAVAAALGGLVLLFGLAYLLAGPRNTQIFLERVVPHLGATTAYAENQTLAAFLARLIEPEMRPIPTEAAAVYWLSRLLFVVGLLAPLALVGLRAPRSAAGADLQYAAWVAAIPIGLPVAWMHYQQLLLLPLLLLAAAWLGGQRPRVGRLAWALYGLALVLIVFGDHYTVLGSDAGELWKAQDARVDAANERLLERFAGPAGLLLSYKLYGALLLWGLCLREAWRASEQAVSRSTFHVPRQST